MTKRLLALLSLAFCTGGALAQDKVEPKDRILRLFRDEFIRVTPGMGQFPAAFKMGADDGADSEKPIREVKFKRPFDMAKYEVTQELYETVMGKNPSRWKGPRNSVEVVSWHEANEFCKKATAELRTRKLIGEDEVIRLPTEAEWEYVCRAGTATRYSFGDKTEELGDYAWFTGNAKGNDPPVGKKKANPWGFYDMHGYIWEWVQDAWQPNYEGAPSDGSARENPQAKERV
ncbi:MAG: formylglycine-generating enzyme family protein, partial [Planctomycetia bacterium]|nr:formylglycine-generating enzyme family protein [Planctomycetia bacterium]